MLFQEKQYEKLKLTFSCYKIIIIPRETSFPLVFRKDQSILSQCQNIETYHVKRNQKWKLGIDKFSINP